MEEGNLRRYLAYAIGETLLVMVGILMALQVNNWNQGKANRTREIQLLKELKSDLIACESFLALGIAHNDFSIKAKDIVIDFVEGKLPLNDTLQSYFNRFWQFNFTKLSNETAYKSIENWGFDNLSNDTLRQQIITLYNFQGKLLEEMFEVEKRVSLGDYLTTISVLMDFEDRNRIQPFGEIPDVKKQQYINFEKLVRVNLQRNIIARKRIAKEIERVKVNVEKEINRLEK